MALTLEERLLRTGETNKYGKGKPFETKDEPYDNIVAD
jgi:hypothetical protein